MRRLSYEIEKVLISPNEEIASGIMKYIARTSSLRKIHRTFANLKAIFQSLFHWDFLALCSVSKDVCISENVLKRRIFEMNPGICHQYLINILKDSLIP